MTPSGSLDKETFESVNVNNLKSISNELRSGQFQFTSGRKVIIAKPGKREKKEVSNIISS